VLVNVMTGVFDPPPDALAVPWTYLVVVAGLTLGVVTAAGAITLRSLRRPPIEVLRDV
jgi:putative ABC transport system permease protein